MIKNHDRSRWIGASDTAIVVGNWNTKTFAKWWAEKLGLIKSNLRTKHMNAGTFFEHKIAVEIGEPVRLDRQIKIRSLCLRVNLDADSKTTVYEIKTHQEPWKSVPKSYWQQIQVQMFATGKRGIIKDYLMDETDYRNYFLPIDKNRLGEWEVAYDEQFIAEVYLPRLKYLARCLKKGVFPNEADYQRRCA